ncbi:efflux RND transporter periplasmic adaptor subunit [Bradyrhizobium erythrophlei]|uniref:Membrane fusion protein, multidrug efflux system n=1 Tax=Bradyrhizobium erythrophlei TaxID=1437360 RepID=A0A1M5IF08_9BRAD|nr:efflux RND transporter periplasmic adaptor subunit [Bradyrhizobium erythrophlei]SHG26835.1 membrane fusion protein, multidrug efflux system [Bradyrhizobium erythrophlei]
MRRLVLITALLAAGAAAILVETRWWQPSPAQSAARGGEVAVPVMTDKARRADVPVFLAGLGTVQAFNSVLIKPRVDGQIVKIRFEEGKDVHAGDILIEIDPAPFEAVLAQAEANKLKDQAQLGNVRHDLARYTDLAKNGAVTAQQLDTTRALAAQTEAIVKADQALIDTAQVQLNYSTIRSPIDGRVGTRLVDAGNIVKASDTTGIVSINQIHPIFVSFALPADSLPQLSAASKTGDVVVTALDRDGRTLATGVLAVIDNQINPATGTINYKAKFENGDDVLWPGQFVNLRIQLAVRRNVIAVPVTAVQQGPDGPYAFVVDGDRIVQKRPLKVGVLNKTIAIIDGGLQAGEQIVTDGQYRIQAGSKVEVAAQTAPPADTGSANSP